LLSEDEALLLLGFEQALAEAGFGVIAVSIGWKAMVLRPIVPKTPQLVAVLVEAARALCRDRQILTKTPKDPKETLYKCRIA
jgi:hypothetical protein